jgi:hypothetical protein
MNKVVADKLGISMRTVEVHRAHIFDKMQVKTAVELAGLLKYVVPKAGTHPSWASLEHSSLPPPFFACKIHLEQRRRPRPAVNSLGKADERKDNCRQDVPAEREIDADPERQRSPRHGVANAASH